MLRLKKKPYFMLGLVLFSMIFPILGTNVINIQDYMEKSVSKKQLDSSKIPVLLPIFIDGNDGWENYVSEDWCSGSGTSEDPYIIQNIVINGEIYGEKYFGIYIRDSTVHFIIRNCEFFNSRYELYWAGIKLQGVSNGQIIGNYLHDNYHQIYLESCDHIKISNNSMANGFDGIYSFFSRDTEISQNTIYHHVSGIRIDKWAPRNNITRNVITSNTLGIYLIETHDSSLMWNVIYYNGNGVFISGGARNSLMWNVIYYNINGVFISGGARNSFSYNDIAINTNGIVTDSTANNNNIFNNIFNLNLRNAIDEGTYNKWDNGEVGNFWSDYSESDSDNDGIGDTPYDLLPIGGSVDNYPIFKYPKHLGEKIIIDDTGSLGLNWHQTALVKWWCTGSGTNSDPYIIENIEINGQKLGTCIEIRNSDVHFIIRNCKFYYSKDERFYAGIKLSFVSNGQLVGNELDDNYHQIYLTNSDHNKIISNSMENGKEGIYLFFGRDNVISQNNILDHVYSGLRIERGYKNTIFKNQIKEVKANGLYMGDMSLDNYCYENEISDCKNSGIYISDSGSNDFFNNSIRNNNNGISIPKHTFYSTDNVFIGNKIYGNDVSAYDEDSQNRWDNGISRGNFWSDYTGIDNDSDHIGDTPYEKNGVKDRFPIIGESPSGLKTLILVHGYGGPLKKGWWFKITSELKEYYDNIIEIDYYHNEEEMKDDDGNGVFINKDTPIETIASCLKNYIINYYYTINDNVDFICHSMGGLITRYMIKHYYDDLVSFFRDSHERFFKIDHVCMLGTPNQGSPVSYLYKLVPFVPPLLYIGRIAGIINTQTLQMFPDLSPFIYELNAGDQTPYSNIIKWYTYSGTDDKLAPPDYVILEDGAVNRGPFQAGHDELCTDDTVMLVLKHDLGLEIIDPWLILEILQKAFPNFGSSTSNELTVELNIPDGILNPATVVIEINPIYEMNLVKGTSNVFIGDLFLPEGTHDYAIKARDFHENEYKWEGEITIFDDDTSYPYFNFTEREILITDEEAKYGKLLEWEISDESGISEATVKFNDQIIGHYVNIDKVIDSYNLTTNLPGVYMFEFWARDNDTDPGHEPSELDWKEVSMNKSMIIYDDDVFAPNISINYEGAGLDGDSGTWQVEVGQKIEGISEVLILVDGDEYISDEELGGIALMSYDIAVPNSLGTHSIEVIARNNDNDWVGDQESNSTTATITIYDDDVTPPEITIDYIGNGLDNNPGHFEWNVFDIDSGINEIKVQITYSSTDGSEDFEQSFPGTPTGQWDIPTNLGYYTIVIFARDNDDDRTLLVDSLTIEVSSYQEIMDDDLDPPELSNLVIIPDIFEINISLDAIDESGIGNILIFINEELTEPLSQTQQGNTYYFTLENQWLFVRGGSEVEIRVEDGDNDRPNDALSSSITGTFESVLYQLYEYVNWQLEELITYIDDNLSHCLARFINRKLSRAQEHLQEAFSHVEGGKITCGLFHDKMAKVMIQIAEFKAELFNRFHLLDVEQAKYIVDSIHKIRNNIVIIMGASTGTEQGVTIAYIEVDLLNLIDFIDDEIDYKNRGCSRGKRCCHGRNTGSLKYLIKSTARTLEKALFEISMDVNYNRILSCAQWKLDRAAFEVDQLVSRGKISQELADIIIETINQARTDIESVKNSL